MLTVTPGVPFEIELDAAPGSGCLWQLEALPPGMHLRNPPPPIRLLTVFGNYGFSAREESPGKLLIEESFSLPEQRVQPSQYPRFAAFARAVDEAQSGELQIGP